MTRFLLPLLAILCLAATPRPAAAEIEVSAYGGWQTSPHSTVKGFDPGGVGVFDFTAAWEGKSFSAPPYYGFRGTWWRNGGVYGYGIDFSHAKVYASDQTLGRNGFDRLEMTDGLNIITANVYRRFPSENRRWTPYVGAGLGVSYPHVDVETAGGKTYGYQVTGPAFAWVAGVSYPFAERWSVFGEYKGSYSQNKADLDNGGSLETNIVTNALNVGVSFSF
ncbi:MAG: outer membrane beta-barrel protein [Mangrovicoccus sp.]|nr:outer membrane beta-barrel protein [Mangrovicoccus sp.]